MANRSTFVTLRAQAEGYISAMEKAGQKTREFADGSTEKLQAQREAFNTLGASAITMGGAIGFGVTAALSKFMDFDQQMSYVAAATHESAENMDRLRDAALEAGATTVFTASESANAIEELGKAGVSTEDILAGGLAGALDLAAAGGLGVADAAGIAATALKTFNLEGQDMAHVADLLAAGAGKAMGDVTDLSQALNQSAMVANATGLTIEETTGALSAFAAQGLLGSDAGTSFKSMLQSLTPTSGKAKQTMDELGISAYDSAGNFIGLAEFAGVLKEGLQDLTVEQQQAALKTIFGSDAIRAATVLYSEGEEGIRDWIAAVDDQGYASETAAMRLDNLAGDVEALGGAFDTAMITMGSGGNSAARFVVQSLTSIIDAFNGLPEPVQQTVFWVGAAATAVSVAAGIYLLAIPKIASYKKAMEDLNLTGTKTDKIMTIAGKSLKFLGIASAATAVFSAIIQGMQNMVSESVGLAKTEAQIRNIMETTENYNVLLQKVSESKNGLWNDGTTAVLKSVDEISAALDEIEQFADTRGNEFWNSLWSNLTGGIVQQTSYHTNALRDTFQAMGDNLATAFSSMDTSAIKEAQDWLKGLAKDGNLTNEELLQMINLSPDLAEALTNVATEAGKTADDTTLLNIALGEGEFAAEENADALGIMEDAAKEAQIEVDKLSDAIKGFGSTILNTRSAQRDFEAAIDAATDALKDNGETLDDDTEAGRRNGDALDAIAISAKQLAAAKIEETGSIEDAAQALEDGRQAYIDTAIAMGMDETAAIDLADSLDLSAGSVQDLVGQLKTIPKDTNANVTLNTGDAVNKALAIRDAINGIPTRRQITIETFSKSIGRVERAYGGTIQKAAGGATIGGLGGGVFNGTVFGEGTAKSDSVVTALSKGEEVIQEPWASQFRPLLKAINSGELAGMMAGSAGSSSAPVVNQYITVNNPVTERPEESARRSGQLVAANLNLAGM